MVIDTESELISIINEIKHKNLDVLNKNLIDINEKISKI